MTGTEGKGRAAPAPSSGDPWQRYGWLMAIVWMVFLLFPVQAVAASAAPVPARGLAWVAIAGFAGTYVVGFVIGMRAGWRRPTPAVWACFALAAACAALTVPAIGWEATSFLPFLMAYASYGLGSTTQWIANIAGIALVMAYVGVSSALDAPTPWPLLGVIVMLAAVNTITTWLIDRSVATDDLRVELATSEEREAVARDVHDLLGHSLTVVKLKAELAGRLVEADPARARAELDEIVRLTSEAIGGIRATVTGLRSNGLATQLTASAAALDSAGIAVEVAGRPEALSPAQSLPAGWILREATTNVLRHACASRVRIVLEPGTVVIEDDGAGIRGRPGNGMRGMAERASAAGATLRVEARESAGTRVRVTW